jgi:hypothetical protein
MNLSDCFLPGEILLPQVGDLEKWSVIACDQFTADPDYWARVSAYVGNAPSTLRLMLPEAWLGRADRGELETAIIENMESYLARGLFRALPDSFIYLERTLSGGGLRRGILGLLDLEYYDYREDSCSPIHATEGLVLDRLPPRLRLRQQAALELPHLVVFCDDPAMTVMARAKEAAGPLLYDTPLMEGGGRVKGWRITGEGVAHVRAALAALGEEDYLRSRYGETDSPVLYAVGDGNHSLATAKRIWEELRETLTPEERQSHPARFALAELVDLHEKAIEFEPIHRVLFRTDPAAFLKEAEAAFASWKGRGRPLRCLTAAGEATLTVDGTIGECIAFCEAFMEAYRAKHGGTIDYIHGEAEAAALCREEDRAGLLMPEMDKSDLFPSIIRSGPLPKKSFSIGPARDKRYYLECRRIR